MSDSVQIHTVVSPIFAENAYILWKSGQDEAVVVDPGLDPDAILGFLQKQKLRLTHILNTHGHADHIAGNEAMKRAFPKSQLLIGTKDAPMLTDSNLNLSQGYGFPLTSPKADRLLNEGDKVSGAGLEFDVLDVPGHSPGHIVYVCHAQPGSGDRTVVVGGDVLFQDSIGRTDFPGGSHKLLISGIRNKLFPLPDNAKVLTGHGPMTTIGREKRENPFLS
jgi:glyoxylase-like metal-dependent hydrolase (beta-lactamase superfamily II)